MKKIISFCLVLLSIFSIFSINAFAQENTKDIISTEVVEEVHGIYDTPSDKRVSLLSAGLITNNSLKLSKTSSSLIITANIICSTDVTKCGFTYIKLQRLINGTWTDYTTYCYYDQYSESTTKTFSKTISAPTGYTYRVVCEHYAEKTKLFIFKDTETIYNETSSLVF